MQILGWMRTVNSPLLWAYDSHLIIGLFTPYLPDLGKVLNSL